MLYREASLSQVFGRWKRLEDEEADLLKRAHPTKKFVSRFAKYRSSFLRRMWNLSAFMRTFKQHFTMSFNGRLDHRGTMFERRYHERNHKPEPEGSGVSVSLDSDICGDETKRMPRFWERRDLEVIRFRECSRIRR